ncbi:MAG: tripartite tricarboxylate transporter substrate binding protein [Burkholderiales bacterium]|nr:tripartite tricarboxylate transporter substrate binding protein [Burkholderiales bacterium]
MSASFSWSMAGATIATGACAGHAVVHHQPSSREKSVKPFLAIAVAVSLLGVPLAGFGQGYPAKPVRVVIPWPAGGSNDIVGRVVMQKLADAMGQQFVIDNRAGAAGTIGADVVAKAPADGYTLMVHSTTHLGNAHMYGRKLPYDTLKDFTGVALLSSQAGVLNVHPSLPVKTVREFIALAKARPGQILYSSSGNGSAPHLNMALFISMSGIDIVHVPYRGGPQEVASLVSGETQAAFSTLPTTITHIRSGKLRALAVGTSRRARALPGIPTVSEAGIKGYEMAAWIGVFAPARTPRAVIDRLNAGINKALAAPDVEKRLESQALEPWSASPEEFNARIERDYEKYGSLIRLTGAKID